MQSTSIDKNILIPQQRPGQTWAEVQPPTPPIGRRVRGALRSAALSMLGPVARREDSNFLRCLYCHYVFDDQVEQFDEILSALRSHGSFVDTEQCLDILAGRAPLDGRYFHLSFDDGFRSVLTNAAPLLQRHGVPATVFVPTGLIGARDPLAHTAFPEYSAPVQIMNWDEVEELARLGFEIGSHTQGHKELSKLSRAGLDREIRGSKADLEHRLGVECRAFSWPFGRMEHVSQQALDVVRDAGYAACFGAFRGSVAPGETDPFAIPRNHFEPHWRLSHVKLFSMSSMFAD